MESKRKARIALLDSGAGGLSILKSLFEVNISANIYYIADKAAFPYGELDDATLCSRLNKLVEFCINDFEPDIIIIACNTASTICLEQLRQSFTTPFVGVVPAIKPAVKLTKTNTIGLLATPATVGRTYTDELINQFAKGISVQRHGSSVLVDICESFIDQGRINQDSLVRELKKIHSSNSLQDTFVLACTHFPLIRDEISDALHEMGLEIEIVDSSSAIADRTKHLLTLDSRLIDDYNNCSQITIANTAAKPLLAYEAYLQRKLKLDFKVTHKNINIA